MKHLLTYKLFEQLNTYTEIEFVCYNTEMDSPTTKENQRNLYDDLKKYNGYLLPYLQDWSDDFHEQISLAVIILDKENEEYYKNLIETLSDINEVEIDMINSVTDRRVNEILRGELEAIVESKKEDKKEIKPTTDKQLKKRWDKKRNAILTLGKNIKKLRQRVSKDMDSEDEKTRMIATIVRIMDLTGERIGNESSKDEGHHGVSNFYKKHIKVNDDTISFSYIGKSGVKHRTNVKDDKVARNLKEFMEIPGEVFVTTDGLSIKSPQVNRYLADFDITSKDLRGYRVNKLMSEKLRKLKKPETIGEIKKKFNDVLRDVAEQIGHTPGICRKNYLLPEIEEQWYNGKEIQKV